MLKTYKYRIYPTSEQAAIILNILTLCRHLYNCALEHRIQVYRKAGKTVNKYEQMAELPDIKSEFPEFRGVHSQVLQEVLNKLDKAFQNFFRRIREGDDNPGFPRYKGENRYHSIVYPQLNAKILPSGGTIKLPKIGTIPIELSRPLEGTPKTCTVVYKNGKFYACYSCEVEAKILPPTGKQVGIDMGVSVFAVTSDGEVFEAPNTYRKAEKRLKRAQREASRRKKGSNRRCKAVRKLAKAHEKVANQRRDIAHKTARVLVNNYDIIAHEDLQVNNMLKNHRLAKSIQDAGWNLFFNILAGKAAEAGRRVVKVPPAYTSQVCSSCGEKVKKDLSVRVHQCPSCGLVLDRDINAARNILKIALAS